MKSLEYNCFTESEEYVDVFMVFCEYNMPKYNNNKCFETGWYNVKNGTINFTYLNYFKCQISQGFSVVHSGC